MPKKRSEEEKKEIVRKWKELINMSLSELESWNKNEDKNKASLNRNEASKQGIRSGLQSLKNIISKKKKKFSEWTPKDYDDASAENNFVSRMLGSNPGKEIGDTGMSKWEISLKNWGHNPNKGSSEGDKKMEKWDNRKDKKACTEVEGYRKRLTSLIKKRKGLDNDAGVIKVLNMAIMLSNVEMDESSKNTIVESISDSIDLYKFSSDERSAIFNMIDIMGRTIKTASMDVLGNPVQDTMSDIIKKMRKAYKLALDLTDGGTKVVPRKGHAVQAWKNLLRESGVLLMKESPKPTSNPDDKYQRKIDKLMEKKLEQKTVDENNSVRKINVSAAKFLNNHGLMTEELERFILPPAPKMETDQVGTQVMASNQTMSRLASFYKEALLTKEAYNNLNIRNKIREKLRNIASYNTSRIKTWEVEVNGNWEIRTSITLNDKMHFMVCMRNNPDNSNDGHIKILFGSSEFSPDDEIGKVIFEKEFTKEYGAQEATNEIVGEVIKFADNLTELR